MQLDVFKIDVYAQTVETIQLNPNQLSELYKAIGCETVGVTCRMANGDALFIDDESLLSDLQPPAFQFLPFSPPIFGNALVVGCDRHGRGISPRTTLTEVRSRVKFLDFLPKQEPQITILFF